MTPIPYDFDELDVSPFTAKMILYLYGIYISVIIISIGYTLVNNIYDT